ncbi:MAG TPA: hypothetical protein VIN38_04955 [Thiobacillus sp.]
MSDNPMLSKMEALMKKHRGGADSMPQASMTSPEPATDNDASITRRSPPPNAWLPVLTQLIERGTPPVVTISPPAETILPPAEASVVVEEPLAAEAHEPPLLPTEIPTPIVNNELAEQLMNELGPRLSAVMEQQVASELRKNLDQTVATLLSQLDVNVREIVREAVAEKLRKPHDPSL